VPQRARHATFMSIHVAFIRQPSRLMTCRRFKSMLDAILYIAWSSVPGPVIPSPYMFHHSTTQMHRKGDIIKFLSALGRLYVLFTSKHGTDVQMLQCRVSDGTQIQMER
jgi:hypothetical protein